MSAALIWSAVALALLVSIVRRRSVSLRAERMESVILSAYMMTRP